MKKIYLHEDAIISPLGFTTTENIQAISAKKSALKLHPNSRFENNNFYAGIIDNDLLSQAFLKIGDASKYTKLEQMMILAVDGVLKNRKQTNFQQLQLIVSTTKGNIDILQSNSNFP